MPTKKRSQYQRYINATASLSDVILNSQLPDRHNANVQPEQKLYRAVFMDAIDCIARVLPFSIPPPMRPTIHNYSRRARWDIAKETYHWFFHEEGLITSEQACFAAGVDLDYLREGLQQWVRKYGKLEYFQDGRSS